MCSFVLTCFITSIGHGEPAMTPKNEELQRNLLTCMYNMSITASLLIFQPIQCRQNSVEYNFSTTGREFHPFTISSDWFVFLGVAWELQSQSITTNVNRAVFIWVSSSKWFCITTPHDWLKKLARLFHPIRGKNQNPSWLARTRFLSLFVSYMQLPRALVGSLDCLCSLWLASRSDYLEFGFTTLDWKLPCSQWELFCLFYV